MENETPVVHYLSLRNIPAFEKEKRRNPPSGQKMDYIIDTLNSIGYNVNYVSFSESSLNKIFMPKRRKLSEMTTFFLCPHIPGKYRESIAFRWFSYIYARRYIRKGDVLLVYHTNGMRNDVLREVADKYSLQFIYEVEEIYAFVKKEISLNQVEEEINFLQCADKYIFCNKLLAEKINRKNLPYTVVEGYYKYSRAEVDRFDDGKIHCVYGGIIDHVKGGAFTIVDAAKYLPENYVIHILGYGATESLKQNIEENRDKIKCKVIYEGLKNNDEYIKFISKCHIGLCIQSIKDKYNEFSFPSKLVLYLSCGLRAVACRVKVIEKSKMAELLTFYEENSPECVAKAILEVDCKSEFDSKKIMDSLDNEFRMNLAELINT